MGPVYPTFTLRPGDGERLVDAATALRQWRLRLSLAFWVYWPKEVRHASPY